MKVARSVLLRMAADEDRAERIRDLKAQRPDLTWSRIATTVGVSERSTYDWRRTGALSHEHAIRLAGVFDVDADWLWSGRDPDAPSPDLMGALSKGGPSQLDRIEALLHELNARLKHAGYELPNPANVVNRESERNERKRGTTRPRRTGTQGKGPRG